MEGIISVFRSKGYDGASLNELAEASQLQKASLYHRFQGGKKEIASAVLSYVDGVVEKNIYNTLIDSSLSAPERLNLVVDNIDKVYDGGKETCILRALGMDSCASLFGKQIKESMEKWVDGFRLLGVAFDLDEEEATTRAYRNLVLIQGSLVVSKGIADVTIFKKTLEDIRDSYSKK